MNGYVVLRDAMKNVPNISSQRQEVKNEIKDPIGQAIDARGNKIEFMFVDMSGGNTGVNHWVQFDYYNGSQNTDYKVRIGSVLAAAGAYNEFSTVNGASDIAACTDQGGANVKFTQGISRIFCAKAALVTEIQLTSEDTPQLNAAATYNKIHVDGTITPTAVNVSATQEKSDQRSDLVVIKGSWILDAQAYLEFTLKYTKYLTAKLYIQAYDNVGQFVNL
jgi:hypothetical protein